jgi:membrane protein DedA with SNARE-associated domain
MGRRFGRRWIERHPNKTVRIRRVAKLLDRWGTGYVLIFRFLYGLRTISPIAIGLTTIGVLQFTFLNIVAAALWSAVISGLGFVCGEAIETFLHSMQPWQQILAAVGMVMLVVGCLFTLEQRFLRGQIQESEGSRSSADGT